MKRKRNKILSPRVDEVRSTSADEQAGAGKQGHTPKQAIPGLFQRISPVATWNDLVLTQHLETSLHEMVLYTRHSAKVFDEWGFGAKSSQGRGISALFAGPCGTGRKIAAEAMAAELKRDLYRVDLSLVVSKSAGETDENLRSIFAAAQKDGAVILFDDVDPFFGRRDDDRGGSDRNTGFVAGCLLQRMEAYDGLAIMAATRRNSIDEVFLRRLRFVVVFPLPDRVQREAIWLKVFPSETPVERLDISELARLELNGGHIREVALLAAVLAAEQEQAVCMTHLQRAAEAMFTKLDLPIISAEFSNW